MKIKDIAAAIEESAPLSFQEDYDNAGLITGNPDSKATGALFCVDVTEEVIGEALSLGVNMIISHHPIIFIPIKKINGSNHVERVIISALKNDIAIYAAHTNLDSAKDGISIRMAEMLGLKNIKVLQSRLNDPTTGYGAVGELADKEEAEEFLQKVKDVFKTGAVRHSVINKEYVQKIAVCSGAGSFMAQEAIDAGADLFITADIKYNTFLDVRKEIIIADIGHFESEYCSIEILYEIVTKKFPKFAAHKSVKSENPVIYLS